MANIDQLEPQVNTLDLALVRKTTEAAPQSVNSYLELGWRILKVLTKKDDDGSEFVRYELAWVQDLPAPTPYD
ncbi:hypothetical protein [Achromobacter spanius]|uniref:hypothetical protein n=1 Tax=Achromobacter spanius TaxID=217203 RepID=UPI003A914BBA